MQIFGQGVTPKGYFIGVVLLIVLCSPGCRQHLRIGEVGLSKAAPSRGSMPEDSSTPYLLDARGFNVSDYGRQLPAASSDLGLLGEDEMKRLARNLRARVDQRLLELELKGQSQNSNVVSGLNLIKRKAGDLLASLPKSQARAEDVPEANRVYFSLLEHRAFLENSALVLKDLELLYRESPKHTRNPEFLLSFFGAPIIRSVHYEYSNFTGDGPKPLKFKSAAIQNQLLLIEKLVVLTPERQRAELRERGTNLCLISADYLQNFLNLAGALGTEASDGGRSAKILRIPRVNFPSITPSSSQPGGSTESAATNKYTPAELFAKLARDGQKAKTLVDSMVADINKGFEREHYGTEDLVRARYQLIELNDYLKSLTVQDKFHRLAKPTTAGTTDAYLTLELKTLFLRYADNLPKRMYSSTRSRNIGGATAGIALTGSVEDRRASILVLARVQMEEPREASNYPIIFEPDYAAGHFVNQVDRIIWGPAPYTGKAIDLRFTVLQLRSLDNNMIENGLKGVTGSIALVNPEFAAISPAVNGLFSSILNAATKDQTELDFSFTIPPPEGAGKADTDSLIAETGHYILIKKENSRRRGLETLASAKRDTYRKLIYNPKDARLYHRKFYTNPELNFNEDNLFLDQSYAVIVVTDEYDSTDNLGQLLREQVARRVGERRAARIIPDQSEARDLLDVVRSSTALLNQGTNFSSAALEGLTSQLKQELWTPVSDIRREFIVQTLTSHSDATTLATLGTDPEKWKRAQIHVSKEGKISLSGTVPTELFQIILPSTKEVDLFANVGGLEDKIHYLEMEDLTGRSLSVGDGWWGKITSQGHLMPPTDQSVPLASTRLRVFARSVADKTLVATKEVAFVSSPFETKTEESNQNSIVKVINPGSITNFTWTFSGDLANVQIDPLPKDGKLTGPSTCSLSLAPSSTSATINITICPTPFFQINDPVPAGRTTPERSLSLRLIKSTK